MNVECDCTNDFQSQLKKGRYDDIDKELNACLEQVR